MVPALWRRVDDSCLQTTAALIRQAGDPMQYIRSLLHRQYRRSVGSFVTSGIRIGIPEWSIVSCFLLAKEADRHMLGRLLVYTENVWSNDSVSSSAAAERESVNQILHFSQPSWTFQPWNGYQVILRLWSCWRNKGLHNIHLTSLISINTVTTLLHSCACVIWKACRRNVRRQTMAAIAATLELIRGK